MKKIIIISLFLTNTVAIIAAPYKSAEEARGAIIDTYDPLLKSSNIYTMKLASPNNQFGKPLHEFGKQLNGYILDKQGIVMGRKSKKEPNNMGESNNIFDIWVYLFESFTKLINTLAILRLSPEDLEARRFLEVELSSGSWMDIGIKQVEMIKANTKLDSKKRLADTIILFTQKNIDLIEKAQQDLRTFKSKGA
jgi:hypothetical protein